MRDTEKTYRVRIKECHPNPEIRGKIAYVSLHRKLDRGDIYVIDSIDLLEGNACFNENFYIRDEFLDFQLDETDYLLSTEANKDRLEQSMSDVEKGNTRKLDLSELLGVDMNATNEWGPRSRVYNSGAKRDSDENKPYVHNLQGYTRLRFGYLTRTGAKKYGDGNFLKGFPDESLIQSMDRHWAQYLDGDRSEDHLASILFGINSLMLNEKKAGIPADNWFKKAE